MKRIKAIIENAHKSITNSMNKYAYLWFLAVIAVGATICCYIEGKTQESERQSRLIDAYRIENRYLNDRIQYLESKDSTYSSYNELRAEY